MRADLACPQCGEQSVLRAPTRTLSESLLALLWVVPFRCQACHHRFLQFRMGRRYPSCLVDRREHFRIPVRLYLSFSGGRVKGEGHVVDLSMGGCMIQSTTHVKVDDIFYLEIVLSEHERPVEVAGMVRSVTSRGIGFQFLRKSQNHKRLMAFIQTHAGKGEPVKGPPESVSVEAPVTPSGEAVAG